MIHRLTWAAIGLTGLVAALFFLGWASPALAQSSIAVSESKHEHIFMESITFRLAAESAAKITSVELFYRVSGQTSANKVVLEFDPATVVSVEHVEDMRDDDNYQPPMITFTYWWAIEDEDGGRLKTDLTSFVYEDTRYTWQVLEGEFVRLYWHDQEQEFGQRYFDVAVDAAADLSAEFGVTPQDPASIVIYNSHEELMSALLEDSSEWIGAVNFGDSGCITIGLGSQEWMEEVVIPHELTHAMLYLVTEPPFGGIPLWLHEGLATRSGGGMNPERQAALAEAIENDTLISLRVLNSGYADQRSRAVLFYAESHSLVSFIIQEYGTDKLGELIAVFAKGAHYDDAMIQVFAVDMDGMEDLWREHIGAPPRTGVTRATPAPSATFTPPPTSTRVPLEGDVSVSEPTATVTAIAAVPIPTATSLPPTEITPPPTPEPVMGGPCLGAAPALAALVMLVAFRPRPMR